MEQSFKERVRYIVRKVGSIEKLAQLANVSPRVVGKYLAGESDPSRKRLISLADAASVNVEWLATGSELKERQIDTTIMRDVVFNVEEFFAKNRLSLPPKKKAELIMLLYEEIAEDESKKDSLESRIMRLVRFAG